MVIRLEPLLGCCGDLHSIVVLPHHVQRSHESHAGPRRLFAGSAAFEQRNRLLVVLDGLLVLFVGIKRMRHQPARFGEQDTIIGLGSDS